MSRWCLYCGFNGYNSWMCFDCGVWLFGVCFMDGVSSMNMCKSVSMNNLSYYVSVYNFLLFLEFFEFGVVFDGYVLDGLV